MSDPGRLLDRFEALAVHLRAKAEVVLTAIQKGGGELSEREFEAYRGGAERLRQLYTELSQAQLFGKLGIENETRLRELSGGLFEVQGKLATMNLAQAAADP